MSDKDFVTFLVDETLKLQKSGESSLPGLELKLKDYDLKFLKGEFIPQTQMLRFSAPFGKLDVPVNWSVFSAIAEYTLLDETNDIDGFYSVIKAAWKNPLEKLVVIHADGFCYLVALKSGEDCYLHDIVNPQEWLKAA